jgi:hypothetical protein
VPRQKDSQKVGLNIGLRFQKPVRCGLNAPQVVLLSGKYNAQYDNVTQ